MLPNNLNEIAFSETADSKLIKAIIDNPIRFPSDAKNSFLLWGRNGTGKTVLAHILPAFLEYMRANDDLKAKYDWHYRFRDFSTTITPHNIGKEIVEPQNVHLYTQTDNVHKVLEEIERLSALNFGVLSEAGANLQHFIFDEIDLWSKRAQALLKSTITASPSKSVFYLTTNNRRNIDNGLISRSISIKLDGQQSDFYLKIVRKHYPSLMLISDAALTRIIKATGGDWRQIHDMMFRLETAA